MVNQSDRFERLADFNEEGRSWLLGELNAMFTGSAKGTLISVANLKDGRLGVAHQIPRQDNMKDLGYGRNIHVAMCYKYANGELPTLGWNRFNDINKVRSHERTKDFWTFGAVSRRRSSVANAYLGRVKKHTKRLAEKFDAGELFGPFESLRDLNASLLCQIRVLEHPGWMTGVSLRRNDVDLAFMTKELFKGDKRAPDFVSMDTRDMKSMLSQRQGMHEYCDHEVSLELPEIRTIN